MARIRTVKPEMAFHELLFDLEASTGLPIRFAWAMLPCHVDREGRFKWRPKRLGAQILPYDGVDFEAVMDALLGAGMLVRYEVGGETYGAIPTFKRHQVAQTREPDSKIPEPPADAGNCSEGIASHMPNHCSARGEGKGMEGNGTERLSSLRSESFPSAADADSGIAVRESKRQPGQETGEDRQPETGTSKDFAEAFEAWKRTLPEEAQARVKPTKQRRTKYTARRREGYTQEQIIAAVTHYVHDPWEGRLANATARDFATLLRDGGQVEKFSAMRPGGQARPRRTDPRTEADLLLQEAWQRAQERDDLDDGKREAISRELVAALNHESNPVGAVKAVRERHAL